MNIEKYMIYEIFNRSFFIKIENILDSNILGIIGYPEIKHISKNTNNFKWSEGNYSFSVLRNINNEERLILRIIKLSNLKNESY